MVKNKNLTVRFLQIKGGYVVAYVIGDYNRKGGVGKNEFDYQYCLSNGIGREKGTFN